MNKKEDILNAWIVIEQLSEGSIKKNDKKFKIFDEKTSDFQAVFLDFIYEQKKKENIKDKDFEKSGLALYFDIFNFQEIVNILRTRYNIPTTYEETTNSEKFTFALYFNNQLDFMPSKLFFTMSGYIRLKKELPEDFFQAENSLKKDLSDKFEDKNFNTVLIGLIKQYKTSLANCRYSFVKNLETDDVNLHSFFIDDLKKSKKVETDNLNRYFEEFLGNRQNLDSHKDSQNFDPAIFQSILQPKFYPLGRFPSNPDFALSFMQQIAVNLSLNEKNNIRSVNGPPGTGKTTLLKDIFADLVVEQAKEICKLSNKEIAGSIVYWEKAKFGILPKQIADKSIIVASSNNGAIQNIVNELPLIEDIAEEFKTELSEANYFKMISNSKLLIKWIEGKPVKTMNLLSEERNWGTFSLEGGKKDNIEKLLLTIDFIEAYLKEDYQPTPNIYQEFLQLYHQLDRERNDLQKYSEQLQKLSNLKVDYEKQLDDFLQKKSSKQDELCAFEQKATDELVLFQHEKERYPEEITHISDEINYLFENHKMMQRNFDVLKLQRPSPLWFQKIFNKSKVNQYLKKLDDLNQSLNDSTQQQSILRKNQITLKRQLKIADKRIDSINQKIQQIKLQFDEWVNIELNHLEYLNRKIKKLENIRLQNNIAEIDFSETYDNLQMSNPWFTKEFRIAQSRLFILALKVRKQFLYDNKKHLKTASIIWNKQQDYISKENGLQLVKESWQWLNFVIPVVSTTFASFGRMFYNLDANAIGNLFIDEAGQALPQASVGAIFRSKKVMVVGDPSQIKPVLDLDSNTLNLIGRNYRVNEKFVSAKVSTQTLVDATSQYGFWKNEDEWTGIPLWVHRRSNYPMFTISNAISYDCLMVQGKPKDKSQGISKWFDISGNANDKFVKEQAEFLKTKITERLQENPELKDEIYVISPFKNVAYMLAKTLDSIGFTKRDEKQKPINIGTVHTFQGKESKIVYFVLGADAESSGAARWAVSDPNMMNVAATRAKEEFYIVGDKKLYAELGSKVANKTISIIEDYNNGSEN